MRAIIKKRFQRERRQRRIADRVRGDQSRPRLAVFRSSRQIYAQIIDDAAGHTLVSSSSMSKELRGALKTGGNKGAARKVGATIAGKALQKGITQVVFDRSGYRYHGRIKELADGAREAGLKF